MLVERYSASFGNRQMQLKTEKHRLLLRKFKCLSLIHILSVYNIEGKEVGTIDLSDAVFGVEVNEHLLHMAVVSQLANKRQGTQKAKTRSEVRGGGRKPWRQKGTGHARQGSTRAPQWTGGGVVFAPTPRDYSFKLNKKEKRAALKSALTSRVEEKKFIVLDEINFGEIKTKNFQNVLNNLNVAKALVVLEDGNKNAELSARKDVYKRQRWM